MKYLAAALIGVLLAGPATAESRFEEFRLDPDTEASWARSAAPDSISADASVWVLSESGFVPVAEGSNGFECLVLRGWLAPADRAADIVAPICYDENAAKADMQEQFLQARLAVAGESREEILDAVKSAYMEGTLKPVDRVGFAYMMSGAQRLGPKIGAWKPHFMIYAPYESGAAFQNGFDSGLPIVFDAVGTARATFVVPLAPGETGEHIHPGQSAEH